MLRHVIACVHCGQTFRARPCDRRRFCSKPCYDAHRSAAAVSSASIQERFWSKVLRSDGCWEWQAATSDGYGAIGVGRKMVRASRLAYQFTRGEIPDGLFVLHTCDNPRCVRPDHLFLGTAQDNARDMVSKGRQRKPYPRPPREPVNPGGSPLSSEAVEAIRARYGRGGIRLVDLAVEYGVTKSGICRIVRGNRRTKG